MTPKYESKLIILVHDTDRVLRIKEHIALPTLADEAERGAVLLWDHNGLYYLMCNAALRNHVRISQQSRINQAVPPLTINEFVLINPKLAKLFLGSE